MQRDRQSWIQTIGKIAIHSPNRDPRTLNGSTRVLLALLVAAGPAGASMDDAADAFWSSDRPTSWKVAMRLAASHLSGLLPDGWVVDATDSHLRLVPPRDGWVDAWHIEEQHTKELSHDAPRPDWIDNGPPFDGIDGISLIDAATRRLESILALPGEHTDYLCPLSGPLPLTASDHEELRVWLLETQRVLVTATAEKLAIAREILLGDDLADTHVIVGDRELLLPLGPFAMTFPQLRDEFGPMQGQVAPNTAGAAWRIVADALTERAAHRTQRILIANAHELDHQSLQLASHLIERGPLQSFSIVLLADPRYRDIRWLDFIDRSVTAGCTIQRS